MLFTLFCKLTLQLFCSHSYTFFVICCKLSMAPVYLHFLVDLIPAIWSFCTWVDLFKVCIHLLFALNTNQTTSSVFSCCGWNNSIGLICYEDFNLFISFSNWLIIPTHDVHSDGNLIIINPVYLLSSFYFFNLK